MYLNFFNLTAKPFQITTDPHFLWLGEKHREALATLRYGILDNRGFLLLTGEVGTGKTILVNRLVSSLNSDTIVTNLPDPDLDSMDFYRLLAEGLKMDAPFAGKGEFLIHFRKFLHQSHRDHKQVLLIIDECQRLSHRLLEDIRVLSNIELQDRKLINIFFVGQPEFNNILMTTENRALSQRITVRYNIAALSQQETSAYVDHRLRVAGSNKSIFKITALNEIFYFSGGIPRLINIVCDHALLTAFSNNLKQVDANIVRECAEELRIPTEQVQSDTATLKTRIDALPDEDLVKKSSNAESENDDKQTSTNASQNREPSSGPQMPVVWKLSYLVVILLLLAILAVVIRQYGGGYNRPSDSSGATVPYQNTTADKAEAGRSYHVTPNQPAQRVIPLTAEKPTSQDNAANAKKAEIKIQESHREPEASATRNSKPVDSGQVQASASQSESWSDIQAVRPEAGELGPLPLMKDKLVIPFKINSNEIGQEAYSTLNRIALFLSTHPQQQIIVRGYTDSSGPASYNETVSDFRANAVKSYLIGNGVREENITTYAMGAFNPIASNDVLAGRRKNRRVEIEFVENQVFNN